MQEFFTVLFQLQIQNDFRILDGQYGTHLYSQLLVRLKQQDDLSPPVQDQTEQHRKVSTQKHACVCIYFHCYQLTMGIPIEASK